MTRLAPYLTAFGLFWAQVVSAGGYNSSYNQYYRPQTYDYVTPVIVVGIPVQTLNVKYYFSVGAELAEERKQEKAKPTMPEVEEPRFESFNLIRRQRVVRQAETELDRAVLPLLTTNCATCHKAGKDKPFPLLTAEGRLFKHDDPNKEKGRRQAVYDSVASDEMPKKGPPLTAAQKNILQRWSKEQ